MKKLILAVFLLVATNLFAGVIDCDQPVQDYAQAFGDRASAVQSASRELQNQGADFRAVTVSSDLYSIYNLHKAGGGTLDNVFAGLLKTCSSWQTPRGGVKTTLLVLMWRQGKVGIYYGLEWKKALDDHWNRIKQDYVVPRLVDGDIAGGFIKGEVQLAKRIAAAKDEALHPVVNQTTNQASDLSGLWAVLRWLLFISVLGGLIALYFYLRGLAVRGRAVVLAAQQAAMSSRGKTVTLYRRLTDVFNTKERDGEKIDATAQMHFNAASESYTDAATMESMNPDVANQPPSYYNGIAAEYERIYELLCDAERNLAGIKWVSGGGAGSDTPKPKPAERHPHHRQHEAQQRQYESATRPVGPSSYVPQEVTYTPPVQQTIINESPEREYERPIPIYREPEPEPVKKEGWGGGSSTYEREPDPEPEPEKQAWSGGSSDYEQPEQQQEQSEPTTEQDENY